MNITLKSQKGVTLVALLTIIIVIMILAGISVAMLTGDNGIINQTREASESNTVSEDIDKIKASYSAAEMNELKKADGKKVHIITSDALQKQLLYDLNVESGVTVTGELTVESEGDTNTKPTVSGSFTVTMPNGNKYEVGYGATVKQIKD